MTREEIMQLNTDYLNDCESEHEMNELFYYLLQLQEHEPTLDKHVKNEVNAVLDKIREEINGLIKYYPYPVVSPYQTNNYTMLIEDEVLRIIDKYRAESEE